MTAPGVICMSRIIHSFESPGAISAFYSIHPIATSAPPRVRGAMNSLFFRLREIVLDVLPAWSERGSGRDIGAAAEAHFVAEIALIVERHGGPAAVSDGAPPAALDARSVRGPVVWDHHPLVHVPVQV